MEEKPFSDFSYNEFLKKEKLMGSKCNKCDEIYVPPRSICTNCYASEMEWLEMKGTGKLVAFTCISIGPPFMLKEGYDRNNPYCSGVVELDEMAKVDARIEEVDTKNPESIKVGMPLKVKFLHREEGKDRITYLAFIPEGSS